MRARKMKWQMTRTTNSVHVGKLIASSPGYTRAGTPRCILSLNPGNVLPDIPVGENLAMLKLLETNSQSSWKLSSNRFQDPRVDSSPQGLVEGLDLIRLGLL